MLANACGVTPHIPLYFEPPTAMKRTSRPATGEPTEEEIQHAAYLIWVKEGRPDGRDLEHWHTARERLGHHHGHDKRDVRRRERDERDDA